MAFLARRRSSVPHLAPELDDQALGVVRQQLAAPQVQGQLFLSVGLIEQLFQKTGTDWDRCAHRMSALAEVASPALAQVWCRQRPKDPNALLFRAWVDLACARREGGPADAQATADLCYLAADLRPSDPTPWVVLLALLRLLGSSKQEVFPTYREIVARDRWHRSAHLEMLGYLSPEECGSHSQVLEFVDFTRGSAPLNAPVAALELTMLVNRYQADVSESGLGGLWAGKRWARPDAEAALQRAVADWPRPGFLQHAAALADLNLLAYALIHANRRAQAAQVFQAIGTTVTAWPWGLDGDPVEQFSYGKEQAER